MIDTFFDNYFKNNIIRGIQIFEKNLVIQTFLVLFFLLVLCIVLFLNPEFWSLLVSFRLLLVMNTLNKEMDNISINHALKVAPKTKKYILDYLKHTLKFNHSSQYKELALILKQKGEKNLKSYNLLPYLTMILTVTIFLCGSVIRVYPEHTKDVIFVVFIMTGIFLIFNSSINAIANLFFNGKPKEMIHLSDTIFEIFLEKSINENTLMASKRKNSR
ncbi:hypothetical protein HF394_05275 [Planococcus glaciei]|uniref:Uncharacterized protein n=1 Tax=Planococcus glaciei TaxID=459472 RepID=A0A7H8Q962_9BACL|nr:hypothetical protein [Planococcus glaciei]QKX50042.1 hypothetical protein HF394_05275 [Planococcus glaciei]